MVTYEVQGTLRDAFEVTRNRPMHKEQFRAPTGEDIGLYVERQHRLRVPFAELQAYCRLMEGIWVACPEHLVVLKLPASHERANTPKEFEDKQDLVNLLDRAVTRFEHPELLVNHLTPKDWSDLRQVCQDSEITDAPHGGSKREGRKLRLKLVHTLGQFEAGQTPAGVGGASQEAIAPTGPAPDLAAAARSHAGWPSAPTPEVARAFPGSRPLPSRISNRLHRPEALVSLAALCRAAGWDFPLQTGHPVQVEILGASAPGTDRDGRQVHWRNHPGGSYSTALQRPADIIEMLAYEAHEWQAWEVMRRHRRQAGTHRFALLT